MSEVTRILSAIDEGDPHAARHLLPLVYDELRKLAAEKLAHEKPGQTLNPTGLVHEAYLRLVGGGQGARESGMGTREAFEQSSPFPSPQTQVPPAFDSRSHFYAAAAEAMRRILVESARRKKAAKRGGNPLRHELHEIEIAAEDVPEDLVALDAALDELALIDKPAADLVHLRYFAGLSIPDAAETLGISPRTAARLWAYARAWLRQKVEGSSPAA